MMPRQEQKERIIRNFKKSGISDYSIFLEDLLLDKYEEIYNMQFHWIRKDVDCWIVSKKNGVVKMKFYSVDYERKTASASGDSSQSTGNPFSYYYRTELDALGVYNDFLKIGTIL
jgi:hypothetical protein